MEKLALESLRKSSLVVTDEDTLYPRGRINLKRYSLLKTISNDDLWVLLGTELIDLHATAVNLSKKTVFTEYNFGIFNIEGVYTPTEKDFTPLELPAAIGTVVWHRERDAVNEDYRYRPCILGTPTKPGYMSVTDYLYSTSEDVFLSDLFLLKEDEVTSKRSFDRFL